MKKIMLALLLVLPAVYINANSTGMPFVRKELDITFKFSKKCKPIEMKEDIRGMFDSAHKNRIRGYEVRYITFGYKDSAVVDDTVIDSYLVLTRMVLLNIAGDEHNIVSTSDYEEEDVNEEFNAHMGMTSFIRGRGHYTRGYRFVMVNSYFNRDYGVVIQVILFQGMGIFKSVDFLADFYSFAFNDLILPGENREEEVEL